MTKIWNEPQLTRGLFCFGHSYFEHLGLFAAIALRTVRISIFGFRIFAELTLEIMPSGLRPKPGPLDPDLYTSI